MRTLEVMNRSFDVLFSSDWHYNMGERKGERKHGPCRVQLPDVEMPRFVA